jgi:hypothetical protein
MRFPGDVLLGYMTLESLRANADLTAHDETELGSSATSDRVAAAD